MMRRDTNLATALVPASRATENTTYNGQATVTNAAGIAVGSADTVYVHINLGAVAATSVVYTLQLSTLATPTAAGDLEDVDDATITITSDDANTQKVIAVRLDRAVLATANQSDKLYAYVKRVQTGASATLDAIALSFTDHKILPQLANAGASADVEALG